MLELKGFDKGHTNHDLEYCLIKFDNFLISDINPEISYPEFQRCRDLAVNTRRIVFDCSGVIGNGCVVQAEQIKAKSFNILLKHMCRIYENRKYKFELVLSNWMRKLDLECNNLMDASNLSVMIVKYHHISQYNHETLRISLERYMSIYSTFRPRRWDKYCP